MTKLLKMKAGNFRIPVVIEEEKGRIYFQFPFNRALMEEIKSMQGAKWHGYDEKNPRKIWSVKDTDRNRFQIDFLTGRNPYESYEKPLKSVKANRDILYKHQLEMKAHCLTRRQCELACQMGTGKTLVAIEVIEDSGYLDWLWVGPKSALAEAESQFEHWNAKITPVFMTYDRLRIMIKEGDIIIPQGIIFDEASKIKSPTAQRSQAASIIVEEMRKVDPNCFVILMSGAPAPKAPTDWWHQCEVAKPGFLKEGDIFKFRARMAIIREEQSIDGGVYPKLVTWLDDEHKCKVCGKRTEEHFNIDNLDLSEDHPFQPSVNEVSYLYKRMKGLVLVKFKEDCLDLPEMQFRRIKLKASDSVNRAASAILNTEPRTVTALMKIRELSDGFQYKEQTVDGKSTTCDRCKGKGRVIEFYDPDSPGEAISSEAVESGRCLQREEECSNCKGTGNTPKTERTVIEVPTPKDDLLKDLLDEHEPIGRFVVYAGFQASVDRCVKIAIKNGWDVIRVDGRGWSYFDKDTMKDMPVASSMSAKDMLKEFQYGETEKICFIGQAGAAGMGLTLTASPSIFFFSNSFNGEDRIQAMERIHRIGMDKNRGATVIDAIHLDVDEYILNNLEKKIDLLNMSMGKLKEGIEKYGNSST